MGDVTQLYECAVCKRPLLFSHPDINIKVCSCGAVNNRKEGGVILLKPYLTVAAADSIVQPGTTGKWNNEQFTVTGRIRFWFEENVFNYWTIVFAGNTIGYLAEGYGLYAIYRQMKPGLPLPSSKFSLLDINDKVDIGAGADFYVQRKQMVWKFEAEGEAWLPENDGKPQILELASQTGRHVEVTRYLPDYRVYYNIEHASLEQLQLQHTRTYDNPGLSFECPDCKHTVSIKTFPYAQSCACGSCGSMLFYDTGKFSRKGKEKAGDSKSAIPVGTHGTIDGVVYEVIGYNEKQDFSSYQSEWREYTLFNGQNGFAFLSEYNGHWIFLKENLDAPVLIFDSTDNFVYNDDRFQLYNQYGFKIIAAEGEFMGNVLNDGNVTAREFIDPPHIWIREKSKKEGITWFFGTHIAKETVAEAFSVEVPEQTGMGAIDPKGFTSIGKIVSVAFFTSLAFILVFALLSSSHTEKVLLDKDYYFNDTTNTVTAVTGKFDLTKWRSALQFDVYAPVDNDWFELGATLVNADNGTEYSLEQGVEQYHGYEDGESWTEGSGSETAYLTGLPAGKYFLQLQGNRDGAGVNKPGYFTVRVIADVPMWQNLFIILALLLAWPIGKVIITNNNEKKRWLNSDYSPYNYD